MPLIPKLDTIDAVESLIQYRFNHTALLWEALQCSGIIFDSEGQAVLPDGNKRLAIIGETVLRLALADEWYKRSGTTTDFAVQWVQVGSYENLQRKGLELGLERFINTPEYVLAAALRPVGDTVKAILGAIYLDSGLDQVKDVMDALALVSREREVIVID
ncbi:MAG: hypothetical protein ASARMPRED_005972 [Alectoria sarmentosa]|nr:MAG: hypothetical protein ASARMPRED_005972 [Alectoria sarmentosa]